MSANQAILKELNILQESGISDDQAKLACSYKILKYIDLYV
jgi:hypothetical protein